jgi:hypothetical protein
MPVASGPAGMDLGLCWAPLPLLNPLLGLFFCLWGTSAVKHHHLIHIDNGVQYGERAAVDGGDKLDAALDMLLFLLTLDKFLDLTCGLSLKAQALVEKGVDGRNRHFMDSSQSLGAQQVVHLKQQQRL